MGIKIERTGEARGKRFCPLMKEDCIKGWTPSMGKDENGFPREGACAAWEPVGVYLREKDQVVTIFDCTEFRWAVDILEEIAKESFQAGASTDKVANEVAKFHATSIASMPEESRIKLMKNMPRLLPNLPPTPVAPKLENKNGDQDAAKP